MLCSFTNLKSASNSSASIETFCPIAAVPALPWAKYKSSICGLWKSFQPMACSRAPLPTIRTFMNSSVLEAAAGRQIVVTLFPLDGAGRLARDVIDYAVHARHFIDDAVRDACE